MIDVFDIIFIISYAIAIISIPVLLSLLNHQRNIARKLENKIKLYEEEIFISNKSLAYDEDFLEALSSLEI